MFRRGRVASLVLLCMFGSLSAVQAEDTLPIVEAEGQPLAANVGRLLDALDYLGTPLAAPAAQELREAMRARDAARLQQLLDPSVLFVVSLNPESRVKVQRGPGPARLQQEGYTPVLIKIVNESTVTKRLKIDSPQAGPVYAGVAELSMQRQQQPALRVNQNVDRDPNRFLAVEMFSAPPMTDRLSGLEVEYAIALIYCREAGKREATLAFDVGQGTQDLGFRAEVPVLFDVAPAIPVRLVVRDSDGGPTMARLTIRDDQGHVYPPQAKRLAPDFFFQPHIYRGDGEQVALPPGKFMVEAGRGPEYLVRTQTLTVNRTGDQELVIDLQRWLDPAAFGYRSGDHHIHAAGCAHYTSPTEGVTPADMFRQVKGEGLNVGCVLTWGPCFSHQRQFFAPHAHDLSDADTLLKYDLEISGFGSQALGHVCLLHLQDQEYPGSEGLDSQGWPTWTTPVMRWAKEQGGFAGYAHSASGLHIDPQSATRRLLEQADTDGDEHLNRDEASRAFLPFDFAEIDESADGALSRRELEAAHGRAADQLPNFAVPEMNGVGAMEIAVTTAEGVCDFISAMDTARIQEWNTWYHILNCGFPLKVSGETDFPCMASQQVGQGRVYVHLGPDAPLDFTAWCQGLAAGRSYVSDGYAHAVEFQVEGASPGTGDINMSSAGTVAVKTRVAFAPRVPRAVAYGTADPAAGRRVVGDTVLLHGERSSEWVEGGERLVELVMNGQVVASQKVPADGQIHELSWEIPVTHSSWLAVRQFPQLHTNPVNVIVAGRPIRASQRSALWCVAMTELLWKNRESRIKPAERDEARATFARALDRYRAIAAEAGSVE